MNRVGFIIISILFIIYVVNSVRKNRLSIKESFWWLLASFIILILSVFPYSIDYFAKILNIAYPPSLLFVLCILFLLFINFRDSKRISELQTKIVELAQELAIIKEEVKNENKKK